MGLVPEGAVEPVAADPPHGAPVRPALRQTWSELAYLHWPYPRDEVQRLLPEGLTVDTFDGDAWVGLIPFQMRDVRVGRSPVVPWWGRFIEINVRTYVVDAKGRRAVWFFSLDVPRAAIVAVARSVFALPYCWAHASHERVGDTHRYSMVRRWPHAGSGRADIAFSVAEMLGADEVSDLDHFLTARWGLVTQRGRRLLQGSVHHPRWPLHRVTDLHVEQDVIEAAGLPSPQGAPLALYSPGVGVALAGFRRLDPRARP